MSDAMRYYHQSHALLIGIDDYGVGFSPLATAVKGVHELADVLVDSLGFSRERIVMLENADATQRNILRALNNPLLQQDQVGPDDRVIVYFAGHGMTFDTAEGEIGCLVPYDADPGDIFSMIEMDRLTRLANRIYAKHVLFLLDACFSGFATMREVSAGVERQVRDLTSQRARQVITAGMRDQLVSDGWGPGGHSLFTGFLLDGLRGAAPMPGGVLRTHHLAGYLQDQVARHSRSQQTPQYAPLMGSQGGDFIFAVREVGGLPDWLYAAVGNTDAAQRMVAVSRLHELAASTDDDDLHAEALAALEQLSVDRDPLVKSSAQTALKDLIPEAEIAPVTRDEPVVIRPESDLPPDTEPLPAAETPLSSSYAATPVAAAFQETPPARPDPQQTPLARPAPAPRKRKRRSPSPLLVGGIGATLIGALIGGVILLVILGPRIGDLLGSISSEPTEVLTREVPAAEEPATEEPATDEPEPEVNPFANVGTEANPFRLAFSPIAFADDEELAALMSDGNHVIDLIMEDTGLLTEGVLTTSYAESVEGLCEGDYDAAVLNTFAYLYAAQQGCADGGIVAQRFGELTYQSQMMARADSGISDPSQLVGMVICQPDPFSTTGWLWPQLAAAANGVDLVHEATIVDMGSHSVATLAVYHGECDVAFTYVDARTTIEEDAPDVYEVLNVFWTSPPIPNDVMAFHPDVPAEVRQSVTTLFLDMANDPGPLAYFEGLFSADGYVPIIDSDYDDLRALFEEAGYDYADYVE